MDFEHIEHLLWLAVVLSVFGTIAIMQWHGKLPKMSALQDLSATVNSPGGNILLLTSLTVIFFFSGARFTYWVISNSHETAGMIKAGDGLVMAFFSFATGNMAGGAFGALLKTMTGEKRIGSGDSSLTISKSGSSQAQVEITAKSPDPAVVTKVDAPS